MQSNVLNDLAKAKRRRTEKKAIVARSTFRSKNVQSTRGSDHFLEVQMSLRFTTPNSGHYTALHSSTLHYTAVRSSTLHYTKLHNTTLHYTTLRSITLYYTTSHYTTLHSTTLHYTTLHYTILQYLSLHYIPLHYNYNYTTVALTAQLVWRHSCGADRLPVVVRFPAGPWARLKTVDPLKGNGLGPKKIQLQQLHN